MEKFILREKSFDFSLRCVKLFKYLCENEKEYVLSKQFLRSGTAVGALIVEAKYAESKPDFIHKYAIALKECIETIYWIELLYHANFISKPAFESINKDAIELNKMLSSSILTIKKSIKKH